MTIEITAEQVGVALAEPWENYGFSEAGIQHYVMGAKLIIERRLGDLDALNQDALRFVIVEAVAARVRNPEGASTTQTSVDDGSESRTYRRAVGTVEITDKHWELLSPDKVSKTAFTIEMETATGQGWNYLDSFAFNIPGGDEIQHYNYNSTRWV